MALPKLNLRDLFWLVVVVAMGLGWWRTDEGRRFALSKLAQAEADRDRSIKAGHGIYEVNLSIIKHVTVLERENRLLRGQLEADLGLKATQ